MGLHDEVMILHCSNLRPVKRIDLLLETVARIRPRESFKLVILAGEDFSPFQYEVQRLGLFGSNHRPPQGQRNRGLSASRRSGAVHLGHGEFLPGDSGIDVLRLSERCHAGGGNSGSGGGQHHAASWLPPGDADGLAEAIQSLIKTLAAGGKWAKPRRTRAQQYFSADVIVPRYESLYRRVCG